MSKRVEDALDQAQSESPTDAWRYIRKIVNDCQLNAGVFLMDHKKPFTEISNSDEAQSFRKLCEPFTCETGIPPFQGKNGKDFGVYQCKASTTANQTLETMKKHSKPNQPIKICGKDLKDIRLQSGRDLRVGP